MGGLLATAYDQLQLIIYVYIVFSYLTLKFSDLLIRGKSALYISALKFKGGQSCFGTTNHWAFPVQLFLAWFKYLLRLFG